MGNDSATGKAVAIRRYLVSTGATLRGVKENSRAMSYLIMVYREGSAELVVPAVTRHPYREAWRRPNRLSPPPIHVYLI